ncbi:MAG: acyltransferase [Lachnospiraceae bacterium]
MRDEERVIGLDLVRCVALLFIIGVHFFYNNGFYYENQIGTEMFMADVVRWLTFSCVPMFIILTGYLKARSELSAKYYRGIVLILVTWVMASIVCMLYKGMVLGIQYTAIEWLQQFLDYKAADYAWYIELYIGLFLLIPFLNQFFGWEKERKYHIVVLVTMIVTVFLPSILNGYVIKGKTLDLIPNYFVSLWPMAYYFLGAALRKYQWNISAAVCIPLIVALCTIKALVTYISAGGANFYKGVGGGYSDFFVGAITLLLFLLCYQVNIKTMWVRKVLTHVSKRSLLIYLLSSIADRMMKPVFAPFDAPVHYWWSFPAHTVVVFVISLILSEIMYPIVCTISGWITGLVPAWKNEKNQ